MHHIIINTILLLGFGSCFADHHEVKKCHAFAGEDANINLEASVDVFKNCFIVNIENLIHQVASSTSCWNSTQKIIECENNIMKTIAECKSSDEPDFPKNVFKIISDYVNLICLDAPNYKFSVLLEHKICFPSLANAISCFEKFNFFSAIAVVPREVMCYDQKDVHECLLEYINSTCIEDSVFANYVTEAFNYNKPPCAKDSAESNFNTMLFTFVMAVLTAVL